MENFKFSFQENQFFGECLPCTAAVFNRLVDSTEVAWKINTRREVEQAVGEGRPLDKYTDNSKFKAFCSKKQTATKAGEAFARLTMEQRLLQWTQSLKESLPCLIFGVGEFEAVEKTNRQGEAILDENGQPRLFRRRKLENIACLSGLFMFDADHLPMAPCEVYERTKAEGFPWRLGLAHVTSSGCGLRLVCVARPEIGNIADNQIELARALGLLGVIGTTGKPVVDDSCIDASRISYCPKREDILYIDNQILF